MGACSMDANGCYQCHQEGTWNKRLLCNQASMILRLSPCEFIQLVCTSLRTPSVSFPTELPTFVWRELRAAKRSVTCSFGFGSGKKTICSQLFWPSGFFSGQLLWKCLVDLQVGDSHLQFLQGFLLQAVLDKSLAGYRIMNQPIDMYLLEREILLSKHLLIKEAVNHAWNDTSRGSSLHALDGVLCTSHERIEF